jgi:CheY-like chemotaxis protein
MGLDYRVACCPDGLMTDRRHDVRVLDCSIRDGLCCNEWQFSPDLVSVDRDMPHMDGLEFTKQVKEINPNFPIIMVTAYERFYTSEEITASHPDAFLQKPVHMDELLEVIQRL